MVHVARSTLLAALCALSVAGCDGSSEPAPGSTVSAAPEGTPIAFGFLTSAARYEAVLPAGLSTQFSDYGVVTSPSAVQSIQYEPNASFDRDLKKIRDLPPVEGSAPAALFETTTKPRMPVLVWTLPAGTMWVVGRDEGEVDLLARRMVVTGDEDGIPHAELADPLRGGDRSDPSQREEHLLPQAECEFIDAGRFAADDQAGGGDVTLVTVATPYGVTVRCSGDSKDADAIKARAEAIAASLTPVE